MEYTFTTQIVNKDSNLLWNYRLEVPLEIAKKLITHNKRAICMIEETMYLHCALMSDGKGGYFIMMNKENRKLIENMNLDTVTVKLIKDHSKYGMPMPEEFDEILKQDVEIDQLFHQLSPGKQRSILHVLGKLKSPQKRLEKTLIFTEYLKSVQGNLDFRELNLAFKNNPYK